MIALLISIPILGALVAWLIQDNRQRPLVLPVTGGTHLLLTLALLADTPAPALGGWIILDPLGKLILLGASILFFCCALYSVGYLSYRRERSNRVLCMGLALCLAAMSLACVSQHLGLLWIAIESTTLAMAPLIYFNRNARSIEATWKYMLICSIGIAMALLGLYFLAYATVVARQEPTLLLAPLLAQARGLSPAWLNGAFIFLLVGFGTKIGLAPLHTWKPDAYGEAPGLVGALLAGGLVNCGFLGICRIYQICLAAGNTTFFRDALAALGFLSMIFAAVFVLRQADFKRLLAYSSVEHVGFMAIGFGLGKSAISGTVFHLFTNGLTKGVLFLTAANIHRSYNSKRAERVRGVIDRLPWSGWLFMAALFAVTGSPPFATFLSEFMILNGMFADGRGVAGVAVILLFAVIFTGMAVTILPILTGRAGSDLDDSGYRDRLLTVAPPLILLLVTLLFGVWIPAPLQEILAAAAAMLGVSQ
ncbi:MAG TPA: proton-conducting transporter membrane subunit [Geobacteraceae bacterium]|nr:proton-conducting transporter membrane subunit [Geobacteraceae bacterium]